MSEENEKVHHDKMIEGLNMVLEETDFIKRKSMWANEHIDYINSNTRHMLVMIEKMQEQINSLTRLVRDIKSDVESIRKGQ